MEAAFHWIKSELRVVITFFCRIGEVKSLIRYGIGKALKSLQELSVVNRDSYCGALNAGYD